MFDLSQQSIAYLQPVLVGAAAGCAVLAASILVWYLLRRPVLDWRTKLLLLCGLGILPVGTTVMGGTATFEHTKERAFCGSCHVMTPYLKDSEDPTSVTLASRHGRNQFFGKENCYACHQDYGMFGTVVTKLGGMGHVWNYYTEYRSYSLEESRTMIRVNKPFTNSTCTVCHSMTNPGWVEQPDHAQLLDELRSSKASCLGSGCHGPSHPFSKEPGEVAGAPRREGAEQ